MSGPLFHHCTNLHTLRYDVITPHPDFTKSLSSGSLKEDGFDNFYLKSFQWWEQRMGFYPLFLSVGTTIDDACMTGYQTQWARVISSHAEKIGNRFVHINELRSAGTFPNFVLLSFDDAEGVFTDYDAWHFVLNGAGNDRDGTWDITPYEFRQLVKPSYNRTDWLRHARKKPHTVQLLSPHLDFRKATRVWVRNSDTKCQVEDMGFSNVQVRRIPFDNW